MTTKKNSTTAPSLSVRRVLITPAVAEKLLSDPPKNQRKLKPRVVAKYVADMLAKQWDENGETIKLNDQGQVIDGQHRLHAVIESNTEQWMLMVRGVPRKVMSTIDQGSPRTPGDVFGIAGLSNASAKAAIARVLMQVERAHANGSIPAARFSTVAVLAYGQKRLQELELGVEIRNKIHVNMRLAATIAGTLLYLRRFAPEKAETFTQAIIEGSGLRSGSPELLLRNQLMRHEPLSSVVQCRRIAEIVSMFGAYVRGMQLSRSIPLNTNDQGSYLMPVVYVDSGTAIDAKGRAVTPAVAFDTRATKGPKARRKGTVKPKSKTNKAEIAETDSVQ